MAQQTKPERSFQTESHVHTQKGGNPPLSLVQLPIWHLEQFNSNHSLYNIPCTLYFNGQVEVEPLKQSLNTIIRRHETLRTAFTLIEGQPVQMITPLPLAQVPLPVVDLRTLSEAEQNTEVQRLSDEEAKQPFQLDQAPLIQFTLLQLGEERSILFVNAHHLVFDGKSCHLFLQELATGYGAFTAGQVPLLPELPIQYTDFVRWQWQQEKELKTQLSFWQEQLGDTLPVLNLPIDRPRQHRLYQGAMYSFRLANRETTQALITLSHQHKSTLFISLMVALQTLIYGYTNQTHFYVGVTVANRYNVQVKRLIKKLIGMFTNHLAIRADLSGNPTLVELLDRARQVILVASDHAVPFMKLMENVLSEQDFSLIPPFQVMLVFHNEFQDCFKPIKFSDNLILDHIRVLRDNGGAKRDLTFHIFSEREKLIGYLEYDTVLYDASTITQMVEYLINIVEWMVTNPKQRLSDLPLLPENQRSYT